MFRTGQAPSELLSRTDYSQINDEGFIANAVDLVFSSEESAVEDAKVNGAINFLVGKVMKMTKGSGSKNSDSINKRKEVNWVTAKVCFSNSQA